MNQMKKYRKKPVVIEAIQYDGDNIDVLLDIGLQEGKYKILVNDDDDLVIDTLEGFMKVSIGDYVIKGLKGEYYPCKPDIFEMSYQEVSDSD